MEEEYRFYIHENIDGSKHITRREYSNCSWVNELEISKEIDETLYRELFVYCFLQPFDRKLRQTKFNQAFGTII